MRERRYWGCVSGLRQKVVPSTLYRASRHRGGPRCVCVTGMMHAPPAGGLGRGSGLAASESRCDLAMMAKSQSSSPCVICVWREGWAAGSPSGEGRRSISWWHGGFAAGRMCCSTACLSLNWKNYTLVMTFDGPDRGPSGRVRVCVRVCVCE